MQVFEKSVHKGKIAWTLPKKDGVFYDIAHETPHLLLLDKVLIIKKEEGLLRGEYV